jgi:hypothetical protein
VIPLRLSVAPGRYWCFRRRHIAADDKEAVSAGDDKRDNHPVAFADRGDLGTRFHHFPHKFMAENIAMVRPRIFPR